MGVKIIAGAAIAKYAFGISILSGKFKYPEILQSVIGIKITVIGLGMRKQVNISIRVEHHVACFIVLTTAKRFLPEDFTIRCNLYYPNIFSSLIWVESGQIGFTGSGNIDIAIDIRGDGFRHISSGSSQQ